MVIMDTTEAMSLSSLEEQALKRKERLRNLKRKIPENENTNETAAEVIVPLPKPKFRSYKPQDESLKEAKLEDAEPAAVEEEVKDLLEAGKEKQKGMALKRAEVMHLLNLVESHPIVYTKTTNVSSNKLKDAAWLDITNRFNALIKTHPRKPEQLRLKWENLKKNARKRHSSVNISVNNFKSGFGIPDYIPPDEVLDKVTSILGPSSEGYGKISEIGEVSIDKPDELSTVVVIPTPSDDEEITGPIIDCLEVDVGGEGCVSNIGRKSNTTTETGSDLRKNAYTPRTGNGKSIHQHLMATEVESRIYRNNAIAEYYIAKKKKIEIEIALDTEMLLLQKKKLELEMLELSNKKGSTIDKDKLLIEKKQVDLEILKIQKRKYLKAASLFRASAEGL